MKPVAYPQPFYLPQHMHFNPNSPPTTVPDILGRFRSRLSQPPASHTHFWRHNPEALKHDFSRIYMPMVAKIAPDDCAVRPVRAVAGYAMQLMTDICAGGIALGMAAGFYCLGRKREANAVANAHGLQIAIVGVAFGSFVGISVGLAIDTLIWQLVGII